MGYLWTLIVCNADAWLSPLKVKFRNYCYVVASSEWRRLTNRWKCKRTVRNISAHVPLPSQCITASCGELNWIKSPIGKILVIYRRRYHSHKTRCFSLSIFPSLLHLPQSAASFIYSMNNGSPGTIHSGMRNHGCHRQAATGRRLMLFCKLFLFIIKYHNSKARNNLALEKDDCK